MHMLASAAVLQHSVSCESYFCKFRPSAHIITVFDVIRASKGDSESLTCRIFARCEVS